MNRYLSGLFSISVFDGKKKSILPLNTFLKEVERQLPWLLRMAWNQEDFFSKLTKGTCLVISLGDEICGVACYQASASKAVEPLHCKNSAWIDQILIHPRYRKIGLGRMMIEVMQNYSRYLGKNYLRIDASGEKACLEDFLTHMGFEKIEHLFDGSGSYYQFSLNSLKARPTLGIDDVTLHRKHVMLT